MKVSTFYLLLWFVEQKLSLKYPKINRCGNISLEWYLVMMHLSLNDIIIVMAIVIYRNESVTCCMIYRCSNISQERYIGEIWKGSSNISLNHCCIASLICAIYPWDIIHISAIHHRTKHDIQQLLSFTFLFHTHCIPYNLFTDLQKGDNLGVFT